MDFSRVATAAWESASSVPETSLPALSRTEDSNVVVAITQRLSGPAAKPIEVLDVVALLHAGLVGDLVCLDEVGQVLVHRVHSVLRARLKCGVDLVRLALTDEVADRGRGYENLGGDDPTGAIGRLGQRLADHALQGAGKLYPDLLLLARRGDGADAVDGLGGILRVQGGEDEVTGLSRRERDGDRL